MNKKSLITTILVVQLILLVLITFSTLKLQKTSSTNDLTVISVSAFSLTSTYNALTEDITYLNNRHADNETLDRYVYFVNLTFNNYYNYEITFNRTYLLLRDPGFEMQKDTI